MTTLGDALRSNGHDESTVSYLKVDVENSEVEAIPEWISSGALENVRQIGVELHNYKLGETRRSASTSEELPPVISTRVSSNFLRSKQMHRTGSRPR